jgi:hypothetical protein
MKKILLFTLFIGVLFNLSAQRRNYRTIDVFNNSVEFSIAGGVHALHLWQKGLFNFYRISDELKLDNNKIKYQHQLSIGYRFSPILGVRFAVQGGNTVSILPTVFDDAGKPIASYDDTLYNSIIATHVDMLVSLTNFWKTKAKRKYYDAQIVFGVGGISFRPEGEQDQFTGFAINGGLINSFFLTKNLLLNIEANLALTNDAFPPDYHYNYGGWAMTYNASLGLSYRIPTDQKNKRYSGRR